MHFFFYVVNLLEVVFRVLAALAHKLFLGLDLLFDYCLLLIANLLLLIHFLVVLVQVLSNELLSSFLEGVKSVRGNFTHVAANSLITLSLRHSWEDLDAGKFIIEVAHLVAEVFGSVLLVERAQRNGFSH